MTYDTIEREIDAQTVSAARCGEGEACTRTLSHCDGRRRD